MSSLDELYNKIPTSILDRLNEIEKELPDFMFRSKEIMDAYRDSNSSTRILKLKHLQVMSILTSKSISVELLKYVFTRCSNDIYYSMSDTRAVPIESIEQLRDLETVDSVSNRCNLSKLTKAVSNSLKLDVEFPVADNLQVMGIIVNISGKETFVHFKNVLKFLNTLGVDSLSNNRFGTQMGITVNNGIVMYSNRKLVFENSKLRDFIYTIDKDESNNWIFEDSILKLGPGVQLIRNNKGALTTYTKNLTGKIKIPKLVVKDIYKEYYSKR